MAHMYIPNCCKGNLLGRNLCLSLLKCERFPPFGPYGLFIQTSDFRPEPNSRYRGLFCNDFERTVLTCLSFFFSFFFSITVLSLQFLFLPNFCCLLKAYIPITTRKIIYCLLYADTLLSLQLLKFESKFLVNFPGSWTRHGSHVLCEELTTCTMSGPTGNNIAANSLNHVLPQKAV